jgi:hypothetical protein
VRKKEKTKGYFGKWNNGSINEKLERRKNHFSSPSMIKISSHSIHGRKDACKGFLKQ